jgi:2'-5' RNA ligase
MSIRSFIAIEIKSNNILREIIRIQKNLLTSQADLKNVEPENIHITLKFMGSVPESQIEKIKKIVKEQGIEPFDINLQGIGVFPKINRPRTIWLGINKGATQITNIWKKLEKELTAIGVEPDRRRFHPHLTISRVRSGRNRDELINILQELRNVEVGDYEINHISLKKSVLTPRGPIYTTLAESKYEQ